MNANWHHEHFAVFSRVWCRVESHPKQVYRLATVTKTKRNRYGRIDYVVKLDREYVRPAKKGRGCAHSRPKTYVEYTTCLEDLERLP
jgi:hypothetical protein